MEFFIVKKFFEAYKEFQLVKNCKSMLYSKRKELSFE